MAGRAGSSRSRGAFRGGEPVAASGTVLSWQNLEALPNAVGATWFDRHLVAKAPETIAPTGMGSETGAALRARNVARSGTRPRAGSRIAYARNLLQTLERPELAEVGARIASETGLGYA